MAKSQALNDIQKEIANNHRLSGGAKAYFQRFNALHGGDGGNSDKEDAIGKPEGFGPVFEWDRQAEEVRLSVFVNAADALGAMITGVKGGDTIVVTSASGVASFDEADETLLASIIGLAASVAGGVTTFSGGSADASKLIVDRVTKFAEEEFKQKNVKKMRRDAFGVDPGTDHKARREGGILICMPEAGGTYYSSAKDEKRWLKHHAPRRDSERPDHVEHGFFLVQGDTNHMTRSIGADGEIYIVAWDHKFEDNAGFYHVRLTLKRPV